MGDALLGGVLIFGACEGGVRSRKDLDIDFPQTRLPLLEDGEWLDFIGVRVFVFIFPNVSCFSFNEGEAIFLPSFVRSFGVKGNRSIEVFAIVLLPAFDVAAEETI